ncbi:MAG TPA: glycosyltransferase [Candidatus Saccharimonadales bacterium]|nr:glycosyltransferase [Candidatus Saccharimonadales bacterium]
MPAPKIAIVTDWLTNMGGAEPLLLEIHKLYPNAPIYTSVYNKEAMPAFKDCDVRTTYLQKILPKSLRYKHALWPVLRAYAFRKLDLTEYDIIISTASAEAKAVKKRPGAVHICYCHTPIRYYWSHYEEFKKEFNFGPLTSLIRPVIPLFVRSMRKLDLESIDGIDTFIANSTITQARIKQYYKRPSTIIYPPIDTERFTPPVKSKREGFVVWGRHVPYKRFDIAIEACNKLKAPLTIIGSGPDTERLKKLAGPTITFTGRISDDELNAIAWKSKAFLFPNEEDFGMSAAESLAAGTPVVAYAKGGALDIVQDGETGILFNEQSVDSLVAAIKRLDDYTFLPATLHRKSKRFAKSLFASKIQKVVSDATKR